MAPDLSDRTKRFARPARFARSMVHARGLLAAAICGLVLGDGCSMSMSGRNGMSEDPFNEIHSAHRGSGCQGRTVRTLRPRASPRAPSPTTLPPPRSHQPDDKIHPRLLQMLSGNPGSRIQVIITFRDTLNIPRLHDGEGGFALGCTRRSLLNDFKQIRAADYRTLVDSLAARTNAHVRETFWLSRSVLAEINVDSLRSLAAWHEVVYIQPRFTGQPPPETKPPGANSEAGDDPIEARIQIASDPYVRDGYGGGK